MQTAYKKGLQSNIWKYFLFSLTWRRQFFPILAIYFLTLPNSTAQQIGFYSAVGAIVAFFLEIPSGYFADRFGHKKTLILAKVFLLLSTFFFVIANSFPYFVLGSMFLSLGFAFASGTNSAFMHETLSALKREKEYGKLMSKIGANVSLLSGLLMFLLPMLTAISIRLPLQVNLGFDIIGVFIAISFCNPRKKKSIYQQPFESKS